ncbi:MAG: tRNA pseudouridine(13) synthase TruD, partial [Gammaproteobacteria bacterium]
STEKERLRRGADLDTLPRVMGRPSTSGVIRHQPADFIVRESLAFELTGAGEHLYLLVRKTGQNTRWVAKQLARALDLPFRAVGFAGMKDRHAITEQWFSLYLPGREDPPLDLFAIEGVEILEHRRHSGKLRIGALSGNRFQLVVRELSGDLDELEQRLTLLRDGSVPNYFGAQRFGRGGGNLDLFGDLEQPAKLGRESRSFALSALRSALFNNYLAQRIEEGYVLTPLPGEIVFCAAEQGYRHEPDVRGDGQLLHTAGLLWGAGESRATDLAHDHEQAFFSQYPAATRLLANHDLRMMRRLLMIRAAELEWQLDEQSLSVSFSLARGQYATAILRECLTWA